MDLLERKAEATRISRLYSSLGYDSYAERMSNCLSHAFFKERIRYIPDFDDFGEVIHVEEKRLWRLVGAKFCRVRHCPVCQWRKSKRWQAIAFEMLPMIFDKVPDGRLLFLTLTIKNCAISRLNSTIQKLNKAFSRWVRWKSFPAIGWLKSLDISLNDSQVHPHFHCLLLVNNDYFDNYFDKDWWVDSWRKVAKLNYDPSVYISAIKPDEELSIISEILSYSVKPSDLSNISADNLYQLTNQLHNVRAINRGGVFRNIFKDIDDNLADLIGSKGDYHDTGHYSGLYRLNNEGGGTYQLFYDDQLEYTEVL